MEIKLLKFPTRYSGDLKLLTGGETLGYSQTHSASLQSRVEGAEVEYEDCWPDPHATISFLFDGNEVAIVFADRHVGRRVDVWLSHHHDDHVAAAP